MAQKPTIEFRENGPIIVKDLDELHLKDGKKVTPAKTVALCRCGSSSKKPYCDGTHAKIGFQSKRSSDRVADERKTFEGKKITIHDNRGRCYWEAENMTIISLDLSEATLIHFSRRDEADCRY